MHSRGLRSTIRLMGTIFKDPKQFWGACEGYSLLPFRFLRLDLSRYVAVNEVGEYLVLTRPQLESMIRKKFEPGTAEFDSATSRHFISSNDSTVWNDFLLLQTRSKRHQVADFTRLHMFVVTLRTLIEIIFSSPSLQLVVPFAAEPIGNTASIHASAIQSQPKEGAPARSEPVHGELLSARPGRRPG